MTRLGPAVEVWVDGERVSVDAGASILDACDAAGRYVPRLCHYPGFACCCGSGGEASGEIGRGLWGECGLCAVRLGDGSEVLACATGAAPGTEIITDDPGLRAARVRRLAPILARHPHICLSCPDRDGCSRDECTYGNPVEARCCAEFGRCELARLVGFVDPGLTVPRRAVTASRDAVTEGPIRREPGLCVGCGRCVRVCDRAPEAGRVLEMAAAEGAPAGGWSAEAGASVARPKNGTLRASGCTFCGLCVLVCPAGALTAPGGAGARWLDGRRDRSGLAAPVLPTEGMTSFTEEAVKAVPARPGVLRLLDRTGRVLRVSGVADLRRALADALADKAGAQMAYFQIEFDELYTLRETELLALYAQEWGHLPPGNEVDDDLFGDEPA